VPIGLRFWLVPLIYDLDDPSAPPQENPPKLVVEPGLQTIGRGDNAEIKIPDDKTSTTVSREHCELLCTEDELLLLHKGLNQTFVNAKPVAETHLLAHGDVVRLKDSRYAFRVLASKTRVDLDPQFAWHVGQECAMRKVDHSPFTIGGSAEDDLRIESWPPEAITFEKSDRGLSMKANVPVTCNGINIAPGDWQALKHADVIVCEGHTFRIDNPIRRSQQATEWTKDKTREGPELPTRILLKYRGSRGILYLAFGKRRLSGIQLNREGTRYIDALIDPIDVEPGEAVSYEESIAHIWCGKERTTANLRLAKNRTLDQIRGSWPDVDTAIEVDKSTRTTRFHFRTTTQVFVHDREECESSD
jgi:hypothetical protein